VTAVRIPAVAGTFYPTGAAALARAVDALLDGPARTRARPEALVVPHAGYRCSGRVAASAHRLLRGCVDVRTVAVLGPAHVRDPHGLAVPACDTWRTPLGEVPVDVHACRLLEERGLAHRDDRPHAGEHSIEVQVPFLQRALGGDWSLVPVVGHDIAPVEVADCLDALAGEGVVVIVSTDLSHYLDRSAADERDRHTVGAILRLDDEAVRTFDACGAAVLRGLLVWLRRHGLGLELLDRGTSADTCSGPDRVVGYAALAATHAAIS
jgi:AmmeMemoRadiSam system protein B